MSQWGSKRKEEKAQRLRGSFRARSDADRRRLVKILRHEAHLLGIPVREDGWVSLRDLNYYVGTTSREDLEVLAGRDNKQRMVLYTDRETWIAAESGHSMSGVVGPGRELSAAEVPALLVHGSYAEHTNSIYRHGLQARRAIHLLEIGSRHGRWRADLETAVFVRAQAAAAKGTRFLFTTNNLYLAPQGIAAAFVEQILPWRSGPVPHLPITRMEALEGQRAAARGEESRSQRNRAPAEASASSGYGVPGREANAPTLDVGPFPALSTPGGSASPSVARSAPGEGPPDSDRATAGSSVARSTPGERPSNTDRATETAGPSGTRSAPSEEPSNTARAAALRATLQASRAVSNQPRSSGSEPTVARSEPGEVRDSGETEPSLDAVTWSDGARTLPPLFSNSCLMGCQLCTNSWAGSIV